MCSYAPLKNDAADVAGLLRSFEALAKMGRSFSLMRMEIDDAQREIQSS
jgi:hypothetical protein